jgi:glycosyltransferase involved in cell wall biosynthesis
VRILFANHTSAWSGGEVSLMRVVEGLRDDHEVCIACPEAGKLAKEVDRAGVQRLPLPEVDASLRLHPFHTPRGLGQLGAGGVALAGAARAFKADVIHANTPRAGLMGAVARRSGAPPVVVRAHEHIPLTKVGRGVRAVLVRSASAVAAVSDFTAERFNEGLPRPVATRVYNSIDHKRYDPRRVGQAPVREELGLAPDAVLIGQIAQITEWKGQDTAIRVLAALRRTGLDVHLLLVGQIAFGGKSVRYDNHAFMNSLERLVDELSVRHAVHFMGQRANVPEIMRALDLTLLPSWEEPFGLVTVESLALGTPPLVSANGASPELVEDGVTGRVLPPRQPDAWAAAAGELLRDRAALHRMAEGGPAAASRFRDDVHAREMLDIYERAAGLPPTKGGPGRPTPVAPAADDRSEASWPS